MSQYMKYNRKCIYDESAVQHVHYLHGFDDYYCSLVYY